MTVEDQWPTGPFSDAFGEAFQPDDMYQLLVGGVDYAARIPKTSLAIRMGKPDPTVLGQPDTSTCTFDILGTPVGRFIAQNDWVANFYTGWWTDLAGTTSQRQADGLRADWQINADLTAMNGKTFVLIHEQPLSWTFGEDWSDGWMRDFEIAARGDITAPGGLYGMTQARLRVAYFTANPWNEGGTLIIEHTGDWVAASGPSNRHATPSIAGHQIPANAAWLRVSVDSYYTGLPNDFTLGNPKNISLAVDTAPLVFDVTAPERIFVGEPVQIVRDGATIWSGQVTDLDRTYLGHDVNPVLRSVLKVNCAGPKMSANQAMFTLPLNNWEAMNEAGGTVYRYLVNADLDADKTNASDPQTVFNYFTTDVPRLRTFNTPFVSTDLVQSVEDLWLIQGCEMPKVIDLIEAAAEMTCSWVWETRDGYLQPVRHSYYAGMQPASETDTISLSADDIGVPVQVRTDGSRRVTRWDNAQLGLTMIGEEYFAAIAGYRYQRTEVSYVASALEAGGLVNNYAPQGMTYFTKPDDGGQGNVLAQVFFDRIAHVLTRPLEHVDEWEVPRQVVTDAQWNTLMEAQPGFTIVSITDLPTDLFTDGRTTFEGFLWGWELAGTDTIRLILVDRKQFVFH